MDILHDAQSMFFHALCNLLNIYCSEKCFKQKLWREMKQHFMTSTVSPQVIQALRHSTEGKKICQKYYPVHVFPSLHEVVPFQNMKMLMNHSALSTPLTLYEPRTCKIFLSLLNVLYLNLSILTRVDCVIG